ncbi:hypothetical protein [Kitasatospora purpeofusca]|uniref:hypothetical protein n=1 Tax=Kitasatospora purpeofusca TaxID=67352 RepID=UPI00386C7912|nr:hypothetical protein OIP63_00325 [Kitasatospora purpeofusca]
MRRSGIDKVYARLWRGSALPAHNPSVVPRVPTTLVTTDPALTTPGVIFTWKSEQQDPPYFRINTAPARTTRIAHRGHAVVAGSPVIAVLEWNTDQRPALIQTVEPGRSADRTRGRYRRGRGRRRAWHGLDAAGNGVDIGGASGAGRARCLIRGAWGREAQSSPSWSRTAK